jgi:pilus assembly protein CpaD
MNTVLYSARGSLALLGMLLGGCGATHGNTSLNSVHQPVVEQVAHTLDLVTAGGQLLPAEQARLSDWFNAVGLSQGDRVNVAGDLRERGFLAGLVTARGAALEEAAVAPTPALTPGIVRVSVARSRAYVPNCPDWSDGSTSSLDGATSRGFGCAINSNLAAMVADPQHLLHGAQGTGETVIMTSNKAIQAYRALAPTGAEGLPARTGEIDNE